MSWIVKEGYIFLSQSERENNATEFASYFKDYMTLEAISGILGNIERESAINPGMYEGGSGSGRGLIQWTPGSIIINWASEQGLPWASGETQCYRIKCEGEAIEGCGGTWIPTKNYPYSWESFRQLTDVYEACKAYCYERERAGTVALSERLQYAKKWYEYLSGIVIPDPSPVPVGDIKWYGIIRDVIRQRFLL